MRPHIALLACAVLAGCHRPSEVAGMYINGDSSGFLFPCDDPKVGIIVQDSALSRRYRSTAAANEPVFVRLVGVRGHEGSIYGGQRFLQVRQILEVRPRAAGECPGVAQPLAPLLPR
ncbi:MAG TPA: hypothetical protein VGJ80_04160 [Gemmatimonadales bacterium]